MIKKIMSGLKGKFEENKLFSVSYSNSLKTMHNVVSKISCVMDAVLKIAMTGKYFLLIKRDKRFQVL